MVTLFAVALVAVFAFGQLFTTFVVWDDEGYFLMAYRDFLSGRILYNQVYALYGPLTFFTAALVARFDVANVTHDGFRWITLPAWVAIAAVMAGVVWRWTGRFTIALVTFLLIGLHLKGLAKGVGHPELWIILAGAILLWLALDWQSQPGRQRYAFWTGVVVAAILLLKVNIGLFAFIAVGLAVGLHLFGRLRLVVSGLLTAVAVSLGLALFFLASTNSERYFALTYLVSLATILATAITQPAEPPRQTAGVNWLVAGFALFLCIGLGWTLATGTTPRALYYGLITGPMLLANSYHYPFSDATSRGSLLLSTVGLASIGVLCWHRLSPLSHAAWGLLKTIAAAGLLSAFYYNQRAALTGSLLFLWLLIADVEPALVPGYSNRLLLALLAALLSLQLYPMAGEQVDWAALMPITAAAVLLADGTNCLTRECETGLLYRLANSVAVVGTVLLAGFLFASLGGKTLESWSRWRNWESVNLPGTYWLRLPPQSTARLRAIVSQLTQNCQTVLLVPGLYSFSLWSGVGPIEQRRMNGWPFLWPGDVQRNELRDLRHQSGGCVLVSRHVYEFFRHLAVSRSDSLLAEIERTMRPVVSVQDITLYRFPEDMSASAAGQSG